MGLLNSQTHPHNYWPEKKQKFEYKTPNYWDTDSHRTTVTIWLLCLEKYGGLNFNFTNYRHGRSMVILKGLKWLNDCIIVSDCDLTLWVNPIIPIYALTCGTYHIFECYSMFMPQCVTALIQRLLFCWLVYLRRPPAGCCPEAQPVNRRESALISSQQKSLLPVPASLPRPAPD